MILVALVVLLLVEVTEAPLIVLLSASYNIMISTRTELYLFFHRTAAVILKVIGHFRISTLPPYQEFY